MEESTEKVPPGMGIFLGFLAFVSVGLLLLTPVVTSPAPPGQGWWTQPAFMPLVSLIIFAATSVFLFANHLWSVRKNRVETVDREGVLAELWQWVLPVEYFIYYIGYIYLLGLVGYFLSSLIFAIWLAFRVGLRGRRWVWSCFFFVLAMTALFRWGLNIWFPSPELFEIFPPGIRIFLTSNF